MTFTNITRILTTIAALSVCGPAFAWDYIQNGPGQQIGDGATGTQNNPHANATAAASSSSRATSASRSSATGGQATAAGGSARASGGKGGNVNIGSVGGSGGGSGGSNAGIALSVPGGYGNAPCGGGIGLGGLGLSGGGSGGGTLWEFADCKRMRESAALQQLGFPDAALAELCQIGRVKEAFGGKCPTAAAVAPVRYRPDYCMTASAGELSQHKECSEGR